MNARDVIATVMTLQLVSLLAGAFLGFVVAEIEYPMIMRLFCLLMCAAATTAANAVRLDLIQSLKEKA